MSKQNKTKTNVQIQRTDLWLPEAKRVKGMDKSGEEIQLYGDRW